MSGWYVTEKSYRGWREEASALCIELCGPEYLATITDNGLWAFDLYTAQLKFRNEADMLVFLLRFNPYIDPKFDF